VEEQEVQEIIQIQKFQVLDQAVQESLLLEPQVQRTILGVSSRHKYSNYITSPSRRLQSSYIYSIRNINNINDYVLSF
jgi:hypothetical protein